MKRPFLVVLAAMVLAASLSSAAGVRGAIVTPVAAYGLPAPHGVSPPPNAIDGDLSTFTWTTASGITVDGTLALDLAALIEINRIRLWKDDDPGNSPGQAGSKDLVILYSTDLGPMASRTFSNVAGLLNGFAGTELMVATAVNSNGTVTGDTHDSVNEGDDWASLSFDAVNATAIAIRFQGPEQFNHYKVHEFQVFGPGADGTVVPKPISLAVWLTLATGLVVARRHSGTRKRPRL